MSKVKKMIKPGVYSSSDLEEILGSRMAIKRRVEAGELRKCDEQVFGLYCTPGIGPERAMLMAIAKYYPEAIVSKGSALFHYGFLLIEPDITQFDVPRESSIRIDNGFVKFYRTTRAIGHTTTEVYKGEKLRIYSPERTVFEVLLLEAEPGDLAREVAIKYVKNFGYDKGAQALDELAVYFGNSGRELVNMIKAIYQEKQIE